MSSLSLFRPLLSAFHRTIAYLSPRFISVSSPRTAAHYEATVQAGLEEFARDEIRAKFSVDSSILQGRVLFTTDSKLTDILNLRSINNVFVTLYDRTLADEEMPKNSEELEHLLFEVGDRCDWRNGLGKWLEMSGFDCDIDTLMTKDINLKHRQPKFRISSYRTGSGHSFTSPELCSVFGHVVDTKFGWPIKLKDMDLDIYCNFHENRIHVNITLSPTCLAYRNITITGLTTLKGTTCYALLKRANVQPGDILVDPMAGSGAILLESCDCYKNGEMSAFTIGGELRRMTLKKCAVNLSNFNGKTPSRSPSDLMRLDVTRLPFRDNSVDVFVSDLPFGHRHGTKEINEKLYPALMREMGRTAQLTTGRAVLLTHDYKNMIDAYQRNRDLWTELSDDMVRVGNLKCFIYLYQRTANAFAPSD